MSARRSLGWTVYHGEATPDVALALAILELPEDEQPKPDQPWTAPFEVTNAIIVLTTYIAECQDAALKLRDKQQAAAAEKETKN